mmetsp:Transcript_50322/g.100372  ORF Transcript_50322/g.100372 Transcript_50322/m.100372 type:complete len:103 (+) Transcript_50322:203-511(+)
MSCALMKTPLRQNLCLRGNKISAEGVQYLSKVTGAHAILHEAHCSLSCLFFSETKVSADVFSAVLPKPLAISTLDLRETMPCSPATVPALLASCPFLSILDL